MNRLLLDLIHEYGAAFKVSFSISGLALDQFEQHTPDVIKSFKKLADTGNVEFLAETYAHSLAALKDPEEFKAQIKMHSNRIEKLFGQRPTALRNTELVYSDAIGNLVQESGFNVMLTEGAKHILGWKSPNFLYCNAANPKLKLLLRNYQLSDDIAFRFSNQSWSEWPLTAEKFAGWLNDFDKNQPVVNVFMDYESFGEHQWAETGIFDFFRALPKQVFARTNFKFNTPTEIASKLQPVSGVSVPYPISWADEERDVTAWVGNEMQDEAFDNLYNLSQRVRKSKNPDIQRDWLYLQSSDHFYYMCTKWFSDGAVHKYFNPYSTPYEAFINYMNVLSDFIGRLDKNERKEIAVSDDFMIPDPAAYTKTTAVKTARKGVSAKPKIKANIDSLFIAGKEVLKKLTAVVAAKDLAVALTGLPEAETASLIKKLPAAYRKSVEGAIETSRKPSSVQIEKCRTLISNALNN